MLKQSERNIVYFWVEKPNEDNESTKSVSPEIENTNDCEDSFVTGSVYMYIKEPRKVKLKPINYVCEWVPKCNFEVQEYSEFYSHVITHLSDIRGVKNECSLNLFCDWKNCEFTTTLASEILAHVVYHAVHASAKNRGLQFFQEYIYKVEKPNEDNESTKSVSPEIENTNDCEDSFVTGSVYMYIKEPRKVKLKPINYVCERVPKCNFEVQEYSEFYSHVITHLSDIRGVKNECSLNLFCDWKNCEFTTTLASEILAHVVYHAVHASAKNRGLQFFQEYIYKRDPGFQPGCKDPFSTNEIPILPNEFFCDWAKCGLKFNDPQLFYWHVRGHINYSESETCEWKGCRYKHGCRSKFLRHLMRHSGEQTHSCPFCGLSFSGKERLKEHWLRVEHVPVGGAPFECTRCSKTFVSLVLLKANGIRCSCFWPCLHPTDHLNARKFTSFYCEVTFWFDCPRENY
ncbi:zinc finger protein 3 homolog isoform X2 [Artemia franciscana]|uniref:zinc finger protein 3 homolog isoform X2 n=1 Tax=Artemia franciscana TaxID=6661 RepID=UPI0032DBC033